MNEPQKSQEEPLFSSLPDETPSLSSRKPLKLLNILVLIGILFGLVVSILGAAYNTTTENITMLMSILFSGIYSLLLFFSRKYWVPFVAGENVFKNVSIFAIANALFIIFIGKLNEQLIKTASGIESTPSNFNLLNSIPWLVGIILIFISVQKKHHFSWTIVLLLSGLYEFAVETVQNGILIPLLSGQSINFFNTVSDLFVLGFWQFVILHSPIYLVIFWSLEHSPIRDEEKKESWWNAFKPLLWLFPYSIYFLILFFIFS